MSVDRVRLIDTRPRPRAFDACCHQKTRDVSVLILFRCQLVLRPIQTDRGARTILDMSGFCGLQFAEPRDAALYYYLFITPLGQHIIHT